MVGAEREDYGCRGKTELAKGGLVQKGLLQRRHLLEDGRSVVKVEGGEEMAVAVVRLRVGPRIDHGVPGWGKLPWQRERVNTGGERRHSYRHTCREHTCASGRVL